MNKKLLSKKRKKVVMVTGGFDPVHVGHVRMFKEAKKLGDELIVVINNDHWKRAKARHVFMPDTDRKEIVEAFACVDRVIFTNHSEKTDPKSSKDMSIAHVLEKIMPDIFANGGDRNEEDAENPKSSLYHDIEACKKLGIEMVFNVGHGGKVRSSSDLLREFAKKINKK